MVPANSIYPEFVPDQLLTSDHLNNLFGYLDEQGRLTRTNLIGIGIVCGLEVITKADKSTITITEGCGVTSQGYLINCEEETYDVAVDFDPLKLQYYEKFINKTYTVTLQELKKSGGTTQNELAGQNPVLLKDDNQLNKKIVLLFVELLEEQNKNCDPNSCDDKGKNITVNIRPLLISKDDANKILTHIDPDDEGLVNSQSFNALGEIKMRRFNVPNSSPVSTTDIFAAYQSVLSEDFIDQAEAVLSAAYSAFVNLVIKDYPGGDPFEKMADSFTFLYDGTISKNDLIHIQYYYDLFSDLLQAYDEFRNKGIEMLGTCCPDASLFPRHLLLGEAIPLPVTQRSANRNYFIYSPLFQREDIVNELKSLFRRLVLMKSNFFVPPVTDDVKDPSVDSFIRITPSLLGNNPLSGKAIPYYYHPNTGDLPLYLYWNYNKTLLGKPDSNLSYNAALYKPNDPKDVKDWVVSPLKYDLEPYDFFRIEGIIGKPVSSVLSVIGDHTVNGIVFPGLITTNRLPFEVIAVRTGAINLDEVDYTKTGASFNDLEISYDIARREYEAVIGLSIEWLDKNRTEASQLIDSGDDQRLQKFIVNLMKPIKKLLVDDLPQFITGYTSFINLYEAIETEANSIRDMLALKFNDDNVNDRNFLEDLIDHFDELTMEAMKGPFRALYQAFVQRVNEYYKGEFFSYYAAKNPGIQHKAGVPVGGTFIIVYHNNPVVRNAGNINTGNINIGPILTNRGVAKEKTPVPVATNAPKDIGSLIDEVAALKSKGTDHALLEAKVKEFLTNTGTRTPTLTTGATPLPEVVKTITDGTVIADFYLPYRCCSDSPSIQYIVQIPGNKAPVAVPQSNFDSITIGDGKILELDGSASYDPESLALKSYAWTLGVHSNTATIIDPTAVKTQVTDLKEGRYEFILVVTDHEDAISAPVSVNVSVSPPPNKVPVAVPASNFDNITMGDGKVLTLDGSASNDPDGGAIKTFEWTLASTSPSCTITDRSLAVTDVTDIVTSGSYSFILVVTDQQDAPSASASVTVTVNPRLNQKPVAVAKSNVPVITLGEETTLVLDGSDSSDPDNDPITYLWTVQSGPLSFSFSEDTGVTTQVSELVSGEYVFSLVVTDHPSDPTVLSQVSDPSLVTVIVNQRPEAVATSNLDEITLGSDDVLELKGSDSTDPENGPLTFLWSIPDDSLPCTFVNNSGSTTVVNDLVAGSYVFTLVVTDEHGAASFPATVSVEVRENHPPVADAGLNRVADTGSVVVLDGTGSTDPDDNLASSTWQIADPSNLSTEAIGDPASLTTDLTGSQDGVRYRLILTVKDGNGLQSADDVFIWVRKNSGLEHQCASNDVMVGLFNTLFEIDNDVIGTFKQQFASFTEVEILKNSIIGSQVFFQDIGLQIKFFTDVSSIDVSTNTSQNFASAMSDWLKELTDIIGSSDASVKDTRVVALQFYHTLVALAMYLSCIQDNDFNEGALGLSTILTPALIKIFTKDLVGTVFQPDDKAGYKQIDNLFNDELQRLLTDPNALFKPLYFDFVSSCAIYFEELDKGL